MKKPLSLPGFAALAVVVLALALAGSVAAGVAQAANPVVKGIVVEGNHAIATEKILGAIKATQVGQPATEEVVRKDLQAIMDLGWFFNVSARFAPTDGGVKVIFEVVENPKLKEISLTGAPDVPADKLKEAIGLKPGEIINGKTLQDGLRALLDRSVKEYGIPLRITDVAVDEAGTVKIKLAETRVGQIAISGNQKTKDHVIRRELTLKPGDVLNMKELDKSLRRVLNLGFFDEVGRKFAETKDPDVVDLTIEVKERKTGSAAFGAVYSSSDGLLGYIEVADDNFFGRGQRVNVKWEFGQRRTTYDLGFFEPHLDQHRTSLGVRLYDTQRTLDQLDQNGVSQTYTDHQTGGELTVGRPLSEDTRVYAKLKMEDAERRDAQGQIVENTKGRNRSITTSVVNDTRDFILRPSSGGRNEFSVEWAGTMLGSDYTFTKYNTDLARYFQGFKSGQVVALHLGAGYLDYQGREPVLQRFLVGGADTIRGYENNAFSGDKYLVLNAEYRIPFSKALTGVVFADAGDAWDTNEPVELGKLRTGYGVGLRVDTPVGVMRIDYGIGQQGGKTYFSLGQTF
ncbi:MAG TPA: BamA/TamA family outer membrane protein [Firmicutes bacterium]|nr:BamA/TamA family outer membrane protein [Bacillota bacterium]